MDDLRRSVLEGQVDVSAVDEVSRRLPPAIPPYVVAISCRVRSVRRGRGVHGRGCVLR